MKVIIFFNKKSFDPNLRLKLIADGIQKIKEAFPNIVFGDPLASSCSVLVQVPDNELQKLIIFITDNQLGKIKVNHEALEGR